MRAFHATWPTRRESIEAEGLRPDEMGVVYMANLPHYAAGFLRMRGPEIIGTKVIDVPGHGEVSVPDVVLHETIAIAEIDLSVLDQKVIGEGSDHNMDSGMYPDDLRVVIYEGAIPPAAIVAWYTQPFAT